MEEKDIKLFNKTIHEAKKIIDDIEKERVCYHNKLERLMYTIEKLRTGHDKKMRSLMKKVQKILEEMYKLFDDLTDDGGK